MGMQMKKFQAPTLQKALEMVRQELGDGAIILQADPVKTGILGRNGVEVTAAIDRKDISPKFQITLPQDEAERSATVPGKKGLFSGFLGKRFQKDDAPVKDTAIRTPEKQKLTEEVRKAAEKAATQATTSTPAGTGVASNSGTMGQLYAMKTFVEPLQKQMEEMKAQMTQAKPERAPTSAFLEAQIKDLKGKLTHFIREQKYKDSELSPQVQQMIQFWREKGMTEKQILGFLNRIEEQGLKLDAETSGQILEPILQRYLQEGKTIENPKQKVVCLVGTTGVGKTTTIAKMAAFEKLKLNRTVALVTLDDYKIGATDQLAHYARILEVPFVKLRPDMNFEDQLRNLNVDTIFVDTFGVSPRDEAKLSELRKHITFRDPLLRSRLEVHLAMPVGMPSGDVEQHAEAFSTLKPQYLLFTKWDETDNWGGMLATILAYSIPVSFIGHGQEVPDDLAVFSSRDFARTITRYDN